MKYILLLATLVLLTAIPFAFADTPLDNVNAAIAAAWKIIDHGDVKNFDTDAIFTAEQLELMNVEYSYTDAQRLIKVTFMVEATVRVEGRMTTCKTVSFTMGDSGILLNGPGYGDSTFSVE